VTSNQFLQSTLSTWQSFGTVCRQHMLPSK
jgi:hypothetical protein